MHPGAVVPVLGYLLKYRFLSAIPDLMNFLTGRQICNFKTQKSVLVSLGCYDKVP